MGGEALATFEEIETHRKIMHARFDRSVGLVALKNLWRQKVALDGGKRDLLSRRLHALLEIPMEQEMTDRIFSDVKKRPAWERFNFYAAPTRDNLLGLDAAPENLAEEAAQIAVQEQIVKQDGVSYAKPYSLSAPAALKISVEFEKMSQEGVDSGKLSPAFARGLLLSLLRLGEGDFLDLSKEARHVLSAALRDYPDLTAAAAEEEPLPALVAIDPPAKREVKKQEEDPLYEKWWFWAVIGGVLAGAGGGFAVWRHNQKDPREPATGGGGSGNNGNGSSDDDDDGDGRGASTTVGP
ncbi:MAG: hypothetical protein U1D33_00245 [bacterium]|nr:hypothetical protein [bacterium]